MLIKTHLAFSIATILFFLPIINYKLVFIPVVLISTSLVDIDSMHSYLGNKRIFRPLQFFVKHRGVIHSLSLCIFLSILLAMFLPTFALPFFLGYGGHLFFDSLTVEGIRPFWPFKHEIKGIVNTGKITEKTIFIVLVILDVILFLRLFV